jgi:predicted metal-dependent peptidase
MAAMSPVKNEDRRPAKNEDRAKATLARIARGLRMVTAPLPHLAGLAAAVRVNIDMSVPTMGVFASGRLVANPDFTAKLSERDLIFVLAHELLHLALRTHDRARGSHHIEFNYAHDYIINDMLRHALGLTQIPAGGLDMPGAREKSAEEIVLEMRRNGSTTPSRSRVWEGVIVSADEALGAARQKGGSGEDGQGADMGDVLSAARERAMFPEDVEDQAARTRAMRDLAAKGIALAKAMGAMRGRGMGSGGSQQNVRALRGVYRTPWQVALQRWLEGAGPSERTYARPSRRGDHHGDIVLPGRQRYTMMLNVILDTSGSMTDELPAILGAIADFCEAVGIDEIRVIQCDTEVTGDALLSPVELAEFDVTGYGGSDLTPALQRFAEDPRVTAAIVITDGDILYPTEPMPYAVLWAVPGAQTSFAPPYGRVITMPRD